jgi:hypothetical protein
MNLYSSLLALPLSAGLMIAQTPTQTPTQTGTPQSTQEHESSTAGQTSGQTMYGILVAADCNAATMPRTSASSMNSSTSSSTSSSSSMNRKTPSDVDRGTATDRAKSSDMNRDRAREVNQGTGGTDAQLDRTRSMDQTGSADRSMQRGTPTDTQAGNNQTGEMSNAANWDKACFITPTTSSFAFQTQDGRVLHFDSAGDSQIKSQLDSTSRVASKNKIFRVRVTGTADGETIHLTKIVI